MLERTVEEHFVSRAKHYGGEQRKIRYIGRKDATDRVLVLCGQVFFVELKRPKGKPRASQVREHERLRAVGADVRVLDTIEAVDAFFQEVALL